MMYKHRNEQGWTSNGKMFSLSWSLCLGFCLSVGLRRQPSSLAVSTDGGVTTSDAAGGVTTSDASSGGHVIPGVQ